MHRERENLILFQLIAGQRTWRAVRRPNRQNYNTNYSSRNRNRRTYYRRKSNNNQVGSFVKIDYISRRERNNNRDDKLYFYDDCHYILLSSDTARENILLTGISKRLCFIQIQFGGIT